MANKILLSTMHQSKGLERRIVVCFGLNKGGLFFIKEKEDKMLCPNIFYVAQTRAQERLIVVGEDTAEDILPFLKACVCPAFRFQIAFKPPSSLLLLSHSLLSFVLRLCSREVTCSPRLCCAQESAGDSGAQQASRGEGDWGTTQRRL